MIEAYKGFNYIGAYIKLSLKLLRFRFAALLSNTISTAQASSDFAERASINVQAERLLKEYGNSILRLAYSYVHNMSDAEDILQDTLIQYIKACPEFEAPVNEKAWLMRVAGNLSKNKIKYNSIRTADELSEQLQSNEAEDLSFVWDAVKELPTKYSEVIHLYYYEGYSTAQIAEILSKNEQTVRSLLQRGRSRLKAVLKEVYDFE
ncbi:MAG: sigma-70 family RNA polymerase sigma factor [Candidatus Metalachnospira sp.]|nr:sigma-70 family RNA polymerase sigma factor [Candidatus Metalachnospira sp.]